jgi:hypothetical protein
MHPAAAAARALAAARYAAAAVRAAAVPAFSVVDDRPPGWQPARGPTGRAAREGGAQRTVAVLALKRSVCFVNLLFGCYAENFRNGRRRTSAAEAAAPSGVVDSTRSGRASDLDLGRARRKA